jgi:hypothetical protein
MNDKNQHGNDLSSLKTKLTLRPGQAGTKQLVVQYGDRLVCVRYRYDPQQKKRVKTVELVIEEIDWVPTPGKRAWNATVGIRITPKEKALQRKVKAAGGKWNLPQKLWELPYHTVLELGLQERIISEE